MTGHTNSPHPQACASAILSELRDRGHQVPDIDTAIRAGYLTDEEWCERLDQFRERAAAHREVERLRLTPLEVGVLQSTGETFQAVVEVLALAYPGVYPNKPLQKSTLAALTRLEGRGFVERGPVIPVSRSGPLQTFRITDAGREALAQHEGRAL